MNQCLNWRELNLTVGPKIALAKILVEFKLAVTNAKFNSPSAFDYVSHLFTHNECSIIIVVIRNHPRRLE